MEIKGLDKLKRKLEQMPHEIERATKEVYREFGEKIEREAKQACPTEEMKNSVQVIFKGDTKFSVNYSEEAKPYVEPVIKRNNEELQKELQIRINLVSKK